MILYGDQGDELNGFVVFGTRCCFRLEAGIEWKIWKKVVSIKCLPMQCVGRRWKPRVTREKFLQQYSDHPLALQ